MRIEEEIKQSSFTTAKQKTGVNIIYTYFWLKERLVKSLKPYGVTMQQYNVLRILNGQYPKGITTSDIRSRMLDKMSDASRLVDRLELHKLVEKKPNLDDRRLVSVRITEKGRELLTEIKKGNVNFDGIFEEITYQEAEELNSLLDKLRG